MEIISCQKVDSTSHGIASTCTVYSVHVKLKDIASVAGDMIHSVTDNSWISKLGVVERASYEARAKQTIERLAKDIFLKVDNVVTEEFGEYLISHTAGKTLTKVYSHRIMPLAELWKEKVIGNPGFDFHAESPGELLLFGEAKYSSSINPYTLALSQINDFIGNEKDVMELSDLKNFASINAINNALVKKKAYVAAFSLNGKSPKTIFKNALKSKDLKNLLIYPELYLIGIEV